MNKLFVSFFAALVIVFTGCKVENEAFKRNDAHVGIKSDMKAALLSLSYDITTWQWSEYDAEKLTEVDLAHLNPSEEKHHIEMVLLPDGTVNMTLEEVEFEKNINIQHQTLPNDIPSVKKTVITGNTVSRYDINGKLLSTDKAEISRQTKLAEQIREMGAQFSDKEIAQAFATMQGNVFDQNFEKWITEAEAKGEVIAHDEQYVTLRMNLSENNTQKKGACVLLVDKNINKLVGNVSYDDEYNPILNMYYGYAKEGVQALNASRTEQLIKLPSGVKVWQITCSKYDNLILNIHPLNK